jgi:hypothetical protein
MANSLLQVIGEKPLFSCDIPLSGGVCQEYSFAGSPSPPAGSFVAIRFPSKEKNILAGPVARLKWFDVTGSFLAQ